MEEVGERDGLLAASRVDQSSGSVDELRVGIRDSGDGYTSTGATGCGALLLCDPRKWAHRYVVLIFMCFLAFGTRFYVTCLSSRCCYPKFDIEKIDKCSINQNMPERIVI